MTASSRYGDSDSSFNKDLPSDHKDERGVGFAEASSELRYDRATGYIYRRKNNKRTAIPKFNGNYVRVSLCGYAYQAHRVIWLLHYGSWPKKFLDHINGDVSDNRICNLREASHAENMRNRKANGRSQYLGVYWHKVGQKWTARIKSHGKEYHLGMFSSEMDAARAYKKAAIELNKEFASREIGRVKEQ